MVGNWRQDLREWQEIVDSQENLICDRGFLHEKQQVV